VFAYFKVDVGLHVHVWCFCVCSKS